MIFTRGEFYSVVFAQARNGRYPGRDYLDGLGQKARDKLVALIITLADTGEIWDRNKFKKVNEALWEFKYPQCRLFCALRSGKVVVLLSGIASPKKKDRLNPTDIARAERLLAEFDQRAT